MMTGTRRIKSNNISGNNDSELLNKNPKQSKNDINELDKSKESYKK
jgi:hypothetical protein